MQLILLEFSTWQMTTLIAFCYSPERYTLLSLGGNCCRKSYGVGYPTFQEIGGDARIYRSVASSLSAFSSPSPLVEGGIVVDDMPCPCCCCQGAARAVVTQIVPQPRPRLKHLHVKRMMWNPRCKIRKPAGWVLGSELIWIFHGVSASVHFLGCWLMKGRKRQPEIA